MSFTLCTSGAAIAKAGASASATAIASAALLTEWSDEAEGWVCMKTRKDWVTDYPTGVLTGVLADLTSDLIAMKIINYDMSGYTQLSEAQTMLNVLKDNSDTLIKDLREDSFQKLNK